VQKGWYDRRLRQVRDLPSGGFRIVLELQVMRKFKRFAAKKIRAGRFLERMARERADLFVHWRLGLTGVFA
jgi:hypothetical protein